MLSDTLTLHFRVVSKEGNRKMIAEGYKWPNEPIQPIAGKTGSG